MSNIEEKKDIEENIELKKIKEIYGDKITGYPHIDKLHEKGYSFFEKNPIIPSISISNAIDLVNLFNKNKTAVDCEELQVKYGELKQDGKTISKSFAELGVKPGDIVPIIMPNYYQAIAGFKGANKMGATTTFLNSHASIDETKSFLNEFECPILFSMDKPNEYFEEILKDTKVKNIIKLNPNETNNRNFNEINSDEIGNNPIIDYKDLSNVAKFQKNKHQKTLFGGNQDALILWTSGSNKGEPKPMLFTNKNVLSACLYLKNSAKIYELGKTVPRWMGVVPFMYPYGFVPSTLATLLSERTAILCPTMSSEYISDFYKKNPNVVFGSPSFLELTKKYVQENQDLSSIKIFVSGGDFLYQNQINSGEEFLKQHGCYAKLANSAGNGEILGAMSSGINNEAKHGSAGKLVIGPKYMLLNTDTNMPAKYGELGELYCSGEHVFKSYFNLEKKTSDAKVEINGLKYYKTGNVGYIDADGYFYMVARATRFYIPSTLNKVYPERVQEVLNKIDCVDSCCVVKKPDEKRMWVGKAYVVLKDGYDANENTKEYILEQSKKKYIDEVSGREHSLTDLEIPAEIEFIDILPRNEKSGKIDFNLLEKKANDEYYNHDNSSLKLIKR